MQSTQLAQHGFRDQQKAASEKPTGWRAQLPAITAAVVTLVLYACTLWGTFVYDDVEMAREDPRLKDPSRWTEYWTNQYSLDTSDRLYRP